MQIRYKTNSLHGIKLNHSDISYIILYGIERKRPASPASLSFLLINFRPPPHSESNHPIITSRHIHFMGLKLESHI